MSKLIVLEGLDGSGKSTQVKKVLSYFQEKNLKHQFFHFPMYGHNKFSQTIEMFLRGEFGDNNDVDPYFVANNYAMDRFMFKPELEKALEENDVVFLDRYVFSNIAYQCAKTTNTDERDKLHDWINEFEFNFLKLPYPNLIMYLDVPIDVIRERLAQKREGSDRTYLNGKEDIHEKDTDFLTKVAEVYQTIKDHRYKNYKIIETVTQDKVLSPDELFENYVVQLETVLYYE